MLAKSYQKIGYQGEPFKENGRMYVLLNTGRKARWYSPEEYHKLYPNDPLPDEEETLLTPNFRKILGFGERGYIYIFSGDTFPLKDELYLAKARYHKIWGWYIIEGIDCPNIDGLTPVKLYWDKISIDDKTLMPESAIQEYVDTLIYPPTDTEWYGAVGDRIQVEVEVIKSVKVENQFGYSTIHTMKDWDGHLFVWTTSAKSWEEGTFHNIKGTVKDHKLYRGDKMTHLTRCQEVK